MNFPVIRSVENDFSFSLQVHYVSAVTNPWTVATDAAGVSGPCVVRHVVKLLSIMRLASVRFSPVVTLSLSSGMNRQMLSFQSTSV